MGSSAVFVQVSLANLSSAAYGGVMNKTTLMKTTDGMSMGQLLAPLWVFDKTPGNIVSMTDKQTFRLGDGN